MMCRAPVTNLGLSRPRKMRKPAHQNLLSLLGWLWLPGLSLSSSNSIKSKLNKRKPFHFHNGVVFKVRVGEFADSRGHGPSHEGVARRDARCSPVTAAAGAVSGLLLLVCLLRRYRRTAIQIPRLGHSDLGHERRRSPGHVPRTYRGTRRR